MTMDQDTLNSQRPGQLKKITQPVDVEFICTFFYDNITHVTIRQGRPSDNIALHIRMEQI